MAALRLPIPISLESTAPSPGSGYGAGDSWWKDPLSDLFSGATGKLEEVLGLDEDGNTMVPLPATTTTARFIPAPVAMPTLLLLGAAGALFLWFRSR